MTPRVVKLGGSLLDLGDLAGRVRRWLEAQSTRSNVFIIGGGPWADAVRAADRIHKLDEVAAHWLCVRAMSVTAELMATLIDWPVVYRFSQRTPAAPNCCIFDVCHFLKHDEPALKGTPLPRGWHVTSDSIAARVAEILSADELVLLKSTLPSGSLDLAAAANQNLVDPWFPTAARSLPLIQVVNLRDTSFPTAFFPTLDPRPLTPPRAS